MQCWTSAEENTFRSSVVSFSSGKYCRWGWFVRYHYGLASCRWGLTFWRESVEVNLQFIWSSLRIWYSPIVGEMVSLTQRKGRWNVNCLVTCGRLVIFVTAVATCSVVTISASVTVIWLFWHCIIDFNGCGLFNFIFDVKDSSDIKYRFAVLRRRGECLFLFTVAVGTYVHRLVYWKVEVF